MTLAIDIAVEHEAWSTIDDLDALADRAITAAVDASGMTVADGLEVSLVLCNDAFIRDLNSTWRGKDVATNVLSFPTDEANAAVVLGDIVVAYETSAREAEEEGQTLRDYLSHLIVHGVCHLLGYDHETDIDADVMEGLETRALTMLGIASPYERSVASAPS